METQKTQIAERLNQATNILVAVSSNPTIDQLAGAIGIALLLNKLNKHATAVFSGKVPSTLEFLQPDKTLEKTTDSLRDFIISLDKSKADKLRYKIEDQMVKIFITPYMTALSDKDLEFSQGDFNVDVVLALGVNEQSDLDQAINAHGRILHDATVIAISTGQATTLGSINWNDPAASSLSEMLTQLGLSLKPDILDGQMSTALLTGIVAETNRFSNEKTSSETMQVSAKLMGAGANQQLVASQLQSLISVPDMLPKQPEPVEDVQLPEIKEDGSQPYTATTPQPIESNKPAPDGALQINHGEPVEEEQAEQNSESEDDAHQEPSLDQIHIDDEGIIKPLADLDVAPQIPPAGDSANSVTGTTRLIMQPPVLGGTLTANSKVEALEPSTDILGTSSSSQATILSHSNDSYGPKSAPPQTPLTPFPEPASSTDVSAPALPNDLVAPTATAPVLNSPERSLADLENLVTSAHVTDQPQQNGVAENPQPTPEVDVNAARDAVSDAMNGAAPQILEPVQSLNAQPMDLNLGDMPAVATSLASAFASNSSAPSLDNPPAASPTSFGTPPPLVPLNGISYATSPLGDTVVPSSTASIMPASHNGSSVMAAGPSAPPPVPPPMIPSPVEQTMQYGQQALPNAENDNETIEPLASL